MKPNNNDTKSNKGKQYKASSNLQIILMAIFFILFSWMISKAIAGFKTDDGYPPLETLTPKKIVTLGGNPIPIDIGLYIRDIPEFDLAKGTFSAEIIVWLKFDPKLISLERIENFAIDRARIKEKSKAYKWIEGDYLVAKYYITGEFSTSMLYNYFPLDNHKISISITNYQLTPTDIILNSSKSSLILNEQVSFSSFRIIDKTVKTGFITDKIDPYLKASKVLRPRAIFSFSISRIGIRHIITIILPLLLIFFIALFSLTFDPFKNYSSTVSVSIAGVTATIAQSFVIANLSPNPGYFMISDKMFLTILVACCIILFVNVAIGKKIKGFYKNIIAILLHVYILSSFTYILYPLF